MILVRRGSALIAIGAMADGVVPMIDGAMEATRRRLESCRWRGVGIGLRLECPGSDLGACGGDGVACLFEVGMPASHISRGVGCGECM